MRKAIIITGLLALVVFITTSCSMRQDLFNLHSLNGSDGGDTNSISVDVGDGLVTSEDLTSDTFFVVLNIQPSGDVILGPIQSLATDEVTVSPSSLTFTTSNWNVPQAVTVTGVDDGIADSVQIAVIDLGTATGGGYDNVDPGDVTVQNLDNETAGSPAVIVINDGLVTSEDGSVTDSFNIKLNEAPMANVTVGSIMSTDTGEVTVSPSSLTFTTANWNTLQTVTLNGVDDFSYDGLQAVSISLGSTTSADPNWDGMGLGSMTAYNLDDDAPKGITVLAGLMMFVSESGGTSQFQVVLNAQPSANVTIPVSSSAVDEGTVSPASLTFTTANWSAPQNVTVAGVDDFLVDNDQSFSIILGAASSSDSEYSGINPPDVTFTNIDDDTPGITVVAGSMLSVSESGSTQSFTVVLNSQPAADVSISVTSTALDEGTVSPASLIFTSANWNAAQSVIVQGVDDAALDGNQPFFVVLGAAVSGDGNYNGINPDDIPCITVDDESGKGILVLAGSSTLVSESGGFSEFEVVLSAAPTANVTINVSSGNASEGTVSPASLTFTTANWDTPQPVQVMGVDDAEQDGNKVFPVILGPASSTDVDYNGIDPTDPSFENIDDDEAGITVSAGSSMLVSESGTTSSFEVVLNSQPAADVDIPVSSDTPAEGAVTVPALGTLTFTTANWNIPQSVTVQGVDDVAVDGNQPFIVVIDSAISGDALYAGIDPGDVSFLNIDNDSTVSKSIVVHAGSSTLVSENGGSSEFEIVLSAAPTADVTIGFSSNDLSEGTVSPASLTFTTANWNTPRQVTVSGVDDFVADGNQLFTVVIGAATSSDPGYNGKDPLDLTFECVDDDTVGITVSAGSSMLVSESGTTSSFEVVLNSQPAADVDIPVSSDTPAEGAVTVPALGTLTFTTANWNIPQSVTVQGVDDFVADGNQPLTVILGPASSSDVNYSFVDPDDVAFVNIDDDTPGITVDWGDGLITDEMGLTDTFKIVLNTEPTADVTISTIQSLDTGEVTVDTSSITFTAANWATPRQVIVDGVDDFLMDGLQSVTIDLGTASSSDGSYNGIDPGDVVVHNIDDESIPQFLILNPPYELITTENGASIDIQIILNQTPTADVTLNGIGSVDIGEGVVTYPLSGSLTFTTANWNVPHTVTVTGVDDAMVDGDMLYDVDLGVATSGDPNWNGLWGGAVTVNNLDFRILTDYVWSIYGGMFSSIVPTGTVLPLIDTDYYDGVTDEMDEGYNYVPIGFTFYYVGMPFNDITVYTNGMASFHPYHYTTNSFANALLFENTATGDLFDNVLAPWWDDFILDQSAASNVYYETTGTAPNRVLTIEWVDARIYGGNEYYNFQIKLYEGTNIIEFVYGPFVEPGNPDDTTASVGIKDDGIGNGSFIDGLDGTTTLPHSMGDKRGVAEFPAIDTVIKFAP